MIDDNELDGKNAEFVASVRERYEQYGARTFASEKQMQWLKRLAGV